MKKLLLAGLVALTAGATSAGTITINNWGDTSTSWSTDYVDKGKVIHKNPRVLGPRESIRISYERGREVLVTVNPWVAQYGDTTYRITDNTNIIVNYTGNAFTLQRSEEYHEYDPSQDIPGFCHQSITFKGNC